MRRKGLVKNIIVYVILSVLLFFTCYPIVFLLVGSLKNLTELISNLQNIFGQSEGYVVWSFLPRNPTLRHYVEVLLDSPGFFVMFWNTVKIVVSVLIGQMVVGVPAAWGFAKYTFAFKKILFFIYIILMVMPFQVRMISEYLGLRSLSLLDTHGALIFPGAFSTFSVFIMYNFFSRVPDGIIEAARLDGANDWQIFWHIGIPLGSGGIFAAMMLSFLEYWNLIEQPLIFLQNQSLWPLSLFSPEVTVENIGIVFVSSVIALIPSIFVFLLGREYLEAGIAATALKE